MLESAGCARRARIGGAPSTRPAPYPRRAKMSTPPAPTRLAIGLRKSALSLCHAEYIRARLLAVYPDCEIVLRGITTKGDQILDQPLASLGGKGLFIQEIEHAMVEGRADFAVHSLKDIPMDVPEGF